MKDLGADFTIELNSQTVSFSSTAPIAAAVGGSYTPTASATSGLPVSLTIDPTSTSGACTISSGTVSFTGVGQCVIDADQPGNYGYDPAARVTQTVSVAAAPQSPAAIIDEWRPVGPDANSSVGTPGDDYVSIANRGSTALSLSGWTLNFVNSGGQTYSVGLSGVNPQDGTDSIPVGGHLLAVDAAYSLGSTPAVDVNYTLPSGFTPVGVKLLDGTGDLEDAVGFLGAPAGYLEGTGLAVPAGYPSGQFSWTRAYSDGVPANSENNAADFNFLSTTDVGSAANGSPSAGVPGPEAEASPIVHNAFLQSSLVDPAASASASPNLYYDVADGILYINRTLTNCSGQPTTLAGCANAAPGATQLTVTRLQFRTTTLSTGILLAESSPGGTFTDASNNSYVVDPLTLAVPAGNTTNANAAAASTGGLNSVLVATPDLGSGLASGQSINVEFAFQVVGHGSYVFAYNAEDDLEPAAVTTTTAAPEAPVTGAPDADTGSSSVPTPVSSQTDGTVAGTTATAIVHPVSIATTRTKVKQKTKTRVKQKTKTKVKQKMKTKAKQRTKSKRHTTRSKTSKTESKQGRQGQRGRRARIRASDPRLPLARLARFGTQLR